MLQDFATEQKYYDLLLLVGNKMNALPVQQSLVLLHSYHVGYLYIP